MADILIPERLAEARKALSITKLEASKRMNIGQATYVRYENGDRNPTFATIIRMGQVLNVNPEYLVGLTDNPDPDSRLIEKKKDPDQYDLVTLFDKLDDEKKKLLMAYVRELYKKKK